MNNPIKPLIIFLVALGGLLFAFSIVQAGVISLSGKGNFNSFFSNAVTIIAGVLSTNFGAVLGITLTPPQQRDSKVIKPSAKFLGLRSSIHPTQAAAVSNTTDANQKFQIIACWVYVGGLLLAFVFWIIGIIKNIPDTQIISLLPELGKTLLGVIVGALTVGLGRK